MNFKKAKKDDGKPTLLTWHRRLKWQKSLLRRKVFITKKGQLHSTTNIKVRTEDFSIIFQSHNPALSFCFFDIANIHFLVEGHHMVRNYHGTSSII